MSTYLLTLYLTHSAIYPQLFELEANSHTAARTVRDRELNQRRQQIRRLAQRCKEDSRRKDILNQISYLHATVELVRE